MRGSSRHVEKAWSFVDLPHGEAVREAAQDGVKIVEVDSHD
jgi:hypothetical protein